MEAQFHAGLCCEFGHGVAKNEEQAAKWYYKAAQQGHAEGNYMLACCYRRLHHSATCTSPYRLHRALALAAWHHARV